MNRKLVIAGGIGLIVGATAIIFTSGSSSEAPPPSSGQPVNVDALFELALVPLAVTSAVFGFKVNDVPIGRATAGDVAEAIVKVGCAETSRESEEPVLVVHVTCAGRPAKVTFVADGALAPDELQQLTKRPDTGALIQVGDAMLAVKAEGQDSGALLHSLQRPSAPTAGSASSSPAPPAALPSQSAR